jgi:hypothetical protein
LSQTTSDQIPPLLLIAKEAGIPGEEGANDNFSLDHIFVDKDSTPTFIEVKRSSDTRIRREVIGQMFDYVAHARAYWTVDKIQNMFNDTWKEIGQNPDIILQDFIEENLNPDQFWEKFMINLKGGNMRLIFVADIIPKRLQLVVEFLRDYMNPCEVRALEVRQFLGEDQLQMIIPRFVGGSVKADIRPGSPNPTQTMTEDVFFARISERAPQEAVQVARKLLIWANGRNMEIYMGKISPTSNASIVPMFMHKGTNHQLFGIWTYGKVEIYYKYIKNYSPFTVEQKMSQLLKMINEIPGINLPLIDIPPMPSFKLELLYNTESYRKFIEIMEWAEQEIREN